jgi:hypothetical protein
MGALPSEAHEFWLAETHDLLIANLIKLVASQRRALVSAPRAAWSTPVARPVPDAILARRPQWVDHSPREKQRRWGHVGNRRDHDGLGQAARKDFRTLDHVAREMQSAESGLRNLRSTYSMPVPLRRLYVISGRPEAHCDSDPLLPGGPAPRGVPRRLLTDSNLF